MRFSRRVEQVHVLESLSMQGYSSPHLMRAMGFGLSPDEEAPMDRSNTPERLPISGRGTSIRMLTDALGVELERITYRRERAVCDHPVPSTLGDIAPGRVVAMRLTFTGVVGGKELIVHEFVWRVDDQVRPDWPRGDETHVRIDGDPTMSMELVTTTELDAKRTPSLHAAMGVVNSIPTVCAAPPGVRTALDLPIWAGASVR